MPGRRTLLQGCNAGLPGRKRLLPNRKTVLSGRNAGLPGRKTLPPSDIALPPSDIRVPPGRKSVRADGGILAQRG